MAVASNSSPPDWSIGFDRRSQIKAAVVAVAFVAVFWKLLAMLPGAGLGEVVFRWVHESDWSHGPIIPLFSAYLVYMRWDQIKRCPIKHAWVGLAFMLFGLAMYYASLWDLLGFGYARPVGMMICLLGVIILLCGLPVMRYAWLPWLYLFFALPIPHSLYFKMTDPLQRLAAQVTCGVLGLLPGLDIERLGTMIHATYRGQVHALSVSDACSGMRSTMVLCALGTAVAFVSWRPTWQRVILVASCIPIATFCNFIRVTVTCCLHVYVDPKYAGGTYHTALGLVVIMLATTMFLGLGWVLNHLFVTEEATRA
jgi:exosortase